MLLLAVWFLEKWFNTCSVVVSAAIFVWSRTNSFAQPLMSLKAPLYCYILQQQPACLCRLHVLLSVCPAAALSCEKRREEKKAEGKSRVVVALPVHGKRPVASQRGGECHQEILHVLAV